MKMRILDNILKRRKKTKDVITTELSTEQREFLEPSYFERMPKTDYTYSRSPSYSRRYLNRSYKIPNMSRHRVRTRVGVTEDVLDVYSSEEEEDGYISSPSTEASESYVTTRTVIEDGMLLRSGKGLQNAKEIFEKHESRAKRRSMTAGQVSSAVSSRSQGRLSLASDMVTSTNMLASENSRSSQTVRSKVRKTLVQEFEGVEKGMKEAANEKRRIAQRESIHNLNHLYGLDSEISGVESEEEYEGLSHNYSGSSRNNSSLHVSNNRRESAEDDIEDISTLTTVTTTVITTIIGKAKAKIIKSVLRGSVNRTSDYATVKKRVSAVTSPVVMPMWNTFVSPVWNAVCYPLWTHVGRPAYSAVSSSVTSTLAVLQYLVARAILWDTWILSRKKNGCCLCIPLLLLLPLLMLSGIVPHVENLASVFSSRQHFQDGISVSNRDNILNSINLKEEVQNIIIQLQHSDAHNQLTVADVERIVANRVSAELSALKLDLSERENQQVAAQIHKSSEEAVKLEELRASLVSNISLLEEKLEAEKINLETTGAEYQTQSSNVVNQLGDDIAALRVRLDGVELAQQHLEAQMRNCCRNDSFLAAAIRDHINTVLAQVVGGQESGSAPQDAFMAWLHNNYVSRSNLEERMSLMAADITSKILAEHRKEPAITITGAGSDISEQLIRSIVDEALLKYSADKIGLPDFALESSGGSVISTRCSETYHKKTAQYSIMGIPLWYASNSPRTVIQPEVHPGSCWAFQGSQGHLVVELSTIITPSGFSIEHIPKSLAPSGKIDSAPKDFLVQGLTGEKDTSGKVLGNCTYNDEGRPLQFFPIQVADPGLFKFVELKILSNHGNPVFTCLYRFRVHGVPYTG